MKMHSRNSEVVHSNNGTSISSDKPSQLQMLPTNTSHFSSNGLAFVNGHPSARGSRSNSSSRHNSPTPYIRQLEVQIGTTRKLPDSISTTDANVSHSNFQGNYVVDHAQFQNISNSDSAKRHENLKSLNSLTDNHFGLQNIHSSPNLVSLDVSSSHVNPSSNISHSNLSNPVFSNQSRSETNLANGGSFSPLKPTNFTEISNRNNSVNKFPVHGSAMHSSVLSNINIMQSGPNPSAPIQQANPVKTNTDTSKLFSTQDQVSQKTIVQQASPRSSPLPTSSDRYKGPLGAPQTSNSSSPTFSNKFNQHGSMPLTSKQCFESNLHQDNIEKSSLPSSSIYNTKSFVGPNMGSLQRPPSFAGSTSSASSLDQSQTSVLNAGPSSMIRQPHSPLMRPSLSPVLRSSPSPLMRPPTTSMIRHPTSLINFPVASNTLPMVSVGQPTVPHNKPSSAFGPPSDSCSRPSPTSMMINSPHLLTSQPLLATVSSPATTVIRTPPTSTINLTSSTISAPTSYGMSAPASSLMGPSISSVMGTPSTSMMGIRPTSTMNQPPSFRMGAPPTSMMGPSPIFMMGQSPASRMGLPPTSIRDPPPLSTMVLPPTSMMGHPPIAMIGPQPTSVMGPPPTSVMGPPPTSMMGPPPTPMMGPPPTSMMGQPPTSMMGQPPTSMMGQPPTSTMGPPPTSMMGPPPTSMMGPPPTSMMGPPPTSLMGPPPTSMRGPPPTSMMGPPPTSVMAPPPKSMMGPPPTSMIGQPSTSAVYPPSYRHIGASTSPILLPPPKLNEGSQSTPDFRYAASSTIRPNSVVGPSQISVAPSPTGGLVNPILNSASHYAPSNSNQFSAQHSPQSHVKQISQQLGGLSVTKEGWNRNWGTNCIDLLQQKVVIPPQGVSPPKPVLQQEYLPNCSPDIFRCTISKVPETQSVLQKSRLPFGIVIHPFKDLEHLAVVSCNTIVRCRSCRTYINPFVVFKGDRRWECNLCFRVNDLPEEFQFDPLTRTYGDPSRRPEVREATIEFIAPQEYMLRPPQPATYIWVLDVSRQAVETGYLKIVCDTLLKCLDKIPGDRRALIGFITFSTTVQFYLMGEGQKSVQMLDVGEIDDIFIPSPEDLLVRLSDSRNLIEELLSSLSETHNDNVYTQTAFGAALTAAYKLLGPIGGRITAMAVTLPTIGPGSLKPREDPNQRSAKNIGHLGPATDFYKKLALDCSGQQIAVDLFTFNSQYIDLATLSGVSRFSGGCMHHFPGFSVLKNPASVEPFKSCLTRYITRKIGFEAVMRIRTTRGLDITNFHGNFFVRSTDLLSLPNINPDSGFGMQISIEEPLHNIRQACFQAALLYTSSKGERRIRVHTLCLPVCPNVHEIIAAGDQQVIVDLLAKMAVDRCLSSQMSDAREAIVNTCSDILTAYKASLSAATSGLAAPPSLQALPLYLLALLKSIPLRHGISTKLDDRVFAMFELKTMPLKYLIQSIYPDLYAISYLSETGAINIEDLVIPQPDHLQLSGEYIDRDGAYLMDVGSFIYVYIRSGIASEWVNDVLGVPSFAAIPQPLYEEPFPSLDNPTSELVRNFLFYLQRNKPYAVPVYVIREDNPSRNLFLQHLVDDRSEGTHSYIEFLQFIKPLVK